jgi:hypothetical protein
VGISRNEELVNIYRQTPYKSRHEVSRIRPVLLGTSAQLCRNNSGIKIIHRFFFECLNSGVDAFDARIEKTRPTVPAKKRLDHI